MIALPVMAKAQVADSSKRVVKVEGATNFRDAGGYKTTDGHIVKWGKVYRSAEINKLTDADMQLMADRHIYTVVDFRGTAESQKAPDRLLPGADYILCPQGSETLAGWQGLIMTLDNGDSLMTSFYSNIDSFGAKYKPFFQKLLQLSDTGALMFHCTAGKDRTGIGNALFLSALGVPYETIMADYLASNVYRQAENEKMVQMMTQYHIKEAVAHDISGVKRAYLQATFDAINKQYGSVENFLKVVMGLDKSEIKILKKKYLS